MHELEQLHIAQVNQLLGAAKVPKRRQARARVAILHERLSPVRLDDGWLLRLPPGASIWRQVRQARLPRHLLVLIGAHTVQYFLVLLSWWLMGRGALEGRLDQGWLLAWALILLTTVPFRLLTIWSQGVLAIGAGGLLKRRLLYGVLRLEPEEVRHQGAGQFFGRVLESQAVESLALGGGFLALVAGVELIMAAVVLSKGAGGTLHVLLFLGWVALALLLTWWTFSYRQRWTEARLGLTQDLVERMVGHRTRLAQEPREHWHDGEDQALERYFALSRETDGIALVQTLVPGGWLIVGLLGLTPAFVSGSGSPAALAVSLGGILLASRTLGKLVLSLSYFMGAAIAWKQVALFFHAGARPEVSGPPAYALALGPRSPEAENGQPVLDACDLIFRSTSGASPFSEVATCGSARVTASSSKAPPVAASPPSPPFSLACACRSPVSSSSRASTGKRLGRRAGGGAWRGHRSSTKTTSSRKPSPSTCCWAAAGRRSPKICSRLKPSVARSALGTSSTACRPDCCRSRRDWLAALPW